MLFAISFYDILILYALAELGFYLWFRLELWQAERTKTRPVTVSLEVRNKHVTKVIALVKRHGAQVLAGWFVAKDGAVPTDRICGDLRQFLAWAFWNSFVPDLAETDQLWITETASRILAETGIPYCPDEGGILLRNTSDPMVISPRPLSLYLIVMIVKLLTAGLLLLVGFAPGEKHGVHYWHRKPSGSVTEEPVVFFHGISPGLVAYVSLLLKLRGEVLIVEMPWVTMSIGSLPPREPLAYAARVLKVFAYLGFDKSRRLVLCGHSYGSCAVSWLLRLDPTLNCRLVLVDPVTLYLVVPKVCFAFLYERPRGVFQRVVRVWAAEEIGVARTMRTDFYWLDCVQYADDLPPDSHVFLSEQDHLVPVDIVHAECSAATGVNVRVFPGVGHGGPFIVDAYTRELVAALHRLDSTIE
jgi:pimeloyl-ACP methyl ester carboxylesterase